MSGKGVVAKHGIGGGDRRDQGTKVGGGDGAFPRRRNLLPFRRENFEEVEAFFHLRVTEKLLPSRQGPLLAREPSLSVDGEDGSSVARRWRAMR